MSNAKRLLLDAGLFAAILLAATPSATGLVLHEWIGFALIVPALLHVALNWSWVEHVVERLLGRTRARARVDLVVDIALFVSAVSVTVSGIAMLPWFSTASAELLPTWRVMHGLASDTTVLFAAAHLALHLTWTAGVVRRAFED